MKKGEMGEGTLKHLWLGFALILSSAQAEVFYSHADHLGSLALRIDSTRKIQEIIHYTPFGEILTTPHSTLNTLHFKYTGQELDRDSDLYNYGARHYDPALGHFLSVDPGWDSLNRYEYGRNNPILYADPDGKNPILKSPDLLVASLFSLYDSYQSASALQEGNRGKALYYSIWAGLDLWTAADFKEPPLLGAVATVATRWGGHAAMAQLVQSPAGREWITKIYGPRAIAELAGYLGISYNQSTGESNPESREADYIKIADDQAGEPITETLGADFFPLHMQTTQPTVNGRTIHRYIDQIRTGSLPESVRILYVRDRGKTIVLSNLELYIASVITKTTERIRWEPVRPTVDVFAKSKYLGETHSYPRTPPPEEFYKNIRRETQKMNAVVWFPSYDGL